jgi:hypothetical protein
MKSQKVNVSILDNGNITVKVTDVYETPINNYDWVLQNITPETAKELLTQLQAAISSVSLKIKAGTTWRSLKTDHGGCFIKGKEYTADYDNLFIDSTGRPHTITDDFIEGNFEPVIK